MERYSWELQQDDQGDWQLFGWVNECDWRGSIAWDENDKEKRCLPGVEIEPGAALTPPDLHAIFDLLMSWQPDKQRFGMRKAGGMVDYETF
jgi:hypothetical protein